MAKAELKFITMVLGEQSVMIIGISMQLVLFADSLVFSMPRKLWLVVLFLTEVARFGLTVFIVMAMNRHCFHAGIILFEIILVAVLILMMLVYVAGKV